VAISSEELEAHLRAYQDALSFFDAKRTAELWGIPGTIVSDTFVGALDSREAMAAGLNSLIPSTSGSGYTMSSTRLSTGWISPIDCCSFMSDGCFMTAVGIY
jgi:hypothetical protein